MSRINEKYILQAVSIRNQYNESKNSIVKNSNKLQSIQNNIMDILKKLTDIKNGNMVNKKEVYKNVDDQLLALMEESTKLQKLIDPINNKMDMLRKQEVELYNELKRVYNNMTDEEIVGDIIGELKKRGIE